MCPYYKLSTPHKTVWNIREGDRNTTIVRDTHYSLIYNWPSSKNKDVKLLKINTNKEESTETIKDLPSPQTQLPPIFLVHGLKYMALKFKLYQFTMVNEMGSRSGYLALHLSAMAPWTGKLFNFICKMMAIVPNS